MTPIRVADEAELHALGMRVDPADPGRAIRADDAGVPDETWDTDALGRYAAAELAESSRLEDEAAGLARRSAVHLFRAGRAFYLVRERLKVAGDWCGWQTRQNIARTSAWEAIELYERAGSEEAVVGLAISEAKTRFGVTRGRTGASTADAPGEAAGGTNTPPGDDDGIAPRPAAGADDVGGGTGPGRTGRTAGRGRAGGRPRGEQAHADGELEVEPDGTARVTAGCLRRLSDCDRKRRLLIFRGWGSGVRAALERGVPCLLLPEYEEGWNG